MKANNLVLAAIVLVAIVVVTASLSLDVIPCDSYWSVGPTFVEIYQALEPQISQHHQAKVSELPQRAQRCRNLNEKNSDDVG